MTFASTRYGVHPRSSSKRAAALILMGAAGLLALAPAPAHAQHPWLQYEDPADAGFDAGKLAAARTLADSAGSAAVMAVSGGHVLVAWGDIARPFMAHSVRKSLYSALYGIAVERGDVDLDATLADLDVDDVPALTETERSARVRDLISARSGVYHGAAYAPSDQAEERPNRGAYPPGEHFFYNNWDFNAASVVTSWLPERTSTRRSAGASRGRSAWRTTIRRPAWSSTSPRCRGCPRTPSDHLDP